MRKKRKRLRTRRLIRLLFLMTLTATMIIGMGQSIKLWAEEKSIKWLVKVDLAESGEPGENIKISTQSDIKETFRENAIIAEFAAEQGLDVSEWPMKLVELLENNPDATDFVLNYPLKKNKVFDIDLSDYENKDSVPLFFQWDERWGLM